MVQGLQLSTRLTQSLVLAPQLQQSLALLQAPTLELKALVEQELQQNPVLEEMTAPEPELTDKAEHDADEVAEPPEENIGAPGTVSRATIEFRERGSVSQPVWKGKVEFYVFGGEKPVQSVSIEKVCPWDGKKFAPLR